MNYTTFILDPLQTVFKYIVTYVPVVLGVLAALLIGALVARAVAKFLSDVLKKIQVDKASHAIQLDQVLETGGLKRPVSDLIAGVVAWGVIITALVIALGYAGINVIGPLTDPVTNYVPTVLGAVIGFMVAIFLAQIVAVLVRVVAANTDMPKPEFLATLTRWAIVLTAFFDFINKVGLGVLLTGTPLLIMIGSLGLALGLAFGLGGRDHANKYLDKVLKH